MAAAIGQQQVPFCGETSAWCSSIQGRWRVLLGFWVLLFDALIAYCGIRLSSLAFLPRPPSSIFVTKVHLEMEKIEVHGQ